MNYEFIWSEYYKERIIRVFHMDEDEAMKVKKFLDKMREGEYD
jgi:hypothetical protein